MEASNAGQLSPSKRRLGLPALVSRARQPQMLVPSPSLCMNLPTDPRHPTFHESSDMLSP